MEKLATVLNKFSLSSSYKIKFIYAVNVGKFEEISCIPITNKIPICTFRYANA